MIALMQRRPSPLIFLLAAALALVSCGGGGGSSASAVPNTAGAATTATNSANPPALPTITQVVSANGSVALTLQAKFDANGRPAFFYNGVETAPTIVVNQGDVIHLHFENSLPEYCAVGVQSNSNMHFHGLTSTPNAPGDDVITTLAAPGNAVDYTVQINTDQPPGMYWYHPHPHGLSSWEVGNGMAGVIIVQGIANYVPQAAGLRERVIVLGDVPNDASFATGESSVRRRQLAAARKVQDADSPVGGNACAPETDATPMINGVPMATIGIRPGETELFRVLNASGHRHFDLAVDGATLTLVAQDGVPIATYPGAPATIAVPDIVIPPAGRAEFLVTGGSAPAALISKCYQSGPTGDTDPEVALGVLANDATAPQQTTATQAARVEKTLSSLRQPKFYRVPLPAPAQARLVHFQEDANGFYINGAAYAVTAPPQYTVASGTVEEWTLENDTQEVHAFHIHQVHFIVESVNGQAVPNPHWVDTYDITPEGVGVTGQLIPSQTKVLIDFRDPVIRGEFVFHCHILDHEDGGMMANILVQ